MPFAYPLLAKHGRLNCIKPIVCYIPHEKNSKWNFERLKADTRNFMKSVTRFYSLSLGV